MRVHVTKPTDADTRAGQRAYEEKLYEKLRAEHIKHDKLIKKEARKDIEHTSKHQYDYHYQAREDDI